MDAAASRIRGERLVRAPGRPYSVVLTVRCRACEWCLRQRAARWAFRAVEEIAHGARTWFATFTFAPEYHVVIRARTSRRLAAGGTDLALLSATEQREELSREYGAEITKYFKRVRKNSGAPLRYILVQEPHKTGLPHFHALIHETNPNNPVRHRTLSTGWKLGYTQFKLCEGSKTAWYVAKYLTKHAGTRVRASLRYGNIDALRRSELKVKRVSQQCPTNSTQREEYGSQPKVDNLKETENVNLQLQTDCIQSGAEPARAEARAASSAESSAPSFSAGAKAIYALAWAYKVPVARTAAPPAQSHPVRPPDAAAAEPLAAG